MARMNRSLLFLFVLLCPALAAAQVSAPSAACRLAPGLWQKRQAFQREFDASGGSSAAAYDGIQSIDAQYRRFVLALAVAYRKKQPALVDSCCDGAGKDPEGAIFCALVHYLLDGRKHPGRLLATLPETPQTATALVDLRQAGSHNASAFPLAADPVYSVTDALFRLMLAGNAKATARYFYLLHHSGGAWADDAADELEHYLTDHSAALIRNWPVLRNYWNLSEGITWDVDADWWKSIVARYGHACSASTPRCREILALLEKASRAASASQ